MIRINSEMESKIVDMARNGNRPAVISNTLDLPTHFVRKIIHKHDVKIVPQSKSENIDIYKIISMLIDGRSLSDIGTAFGVTRQYIYLIKEKCLKAGIKINKEVDKV